MDFHHRVVHVEDDDEAVTIDKMTGDYWLITLDWGTTGSADVAMGRLQMLAIHKLLGEELGV